MCFKNILSRFLNCYLCEALSKQIVLLLLKVVTQEFHFEPVSFAISVKYLCGNIEEAVKCTSVCS